MAAARDLPDVKGTETGKRAVEIAAAGGYNPPDNDHSGPMSIPAIGERLACPHCVFTDTNEQ
jgi:hypothetical protein